MHSFFVHKWYFDELIDLLIVRPVAWLGRFGAQRVRARGRQRRVRGRHVGCRARRLGRGARRAVGFLRYYAALLALGVTALGLYFLIAAS